MFLKIVVNTSIKALVLIYPLLILLKCGIISLLSNLYYLL